MLLDLITGWQERAKKIAPAEGTGILPARGGLPGAAFFPEGLGLQNPSPEADWPWIVAIGHNFGCEAYRNGINDRGHEDDKTTWRNLGNLLWQEIARFFGQPVSVAQRWAKSGMPITHEGRRVYPSPEELNRWLERQSAGEPVQIATESTDLSSELRRGLSNIRKHSSMRKRKPPA